MRCSGVLRLAMLAASSLPLIQAQNPIADAMDMLRHRNSKAPLRDFSFVLRFKDDCPASDSACAAKAMENVRAMGCEGSEVYPELNMATVSCTGTSSTKLLGGLRKNKQLLFASPNREVRTRLGRRARKNNQESVDEEEVPSPPTGPKAPPQGNDTVEGLAYSFALSTDDAYNWGRDRMNQKSLPLDGNTDICPNGGKGVIIYVLDSGCNTAHQELVGRARSKPFVYPNGSYHANFRTGADKYGHGSHTAGVAAGKHVGVAWDATVRCIKVLDDFGNGKVGYILAGATQVLRDIEEEKLDKVVVNLSLGGGTDPSLNAAVASLTAKGVFVVVAAGNAATNAKSWSPASAASAITVAATDRRDQRASGYSNFGTVVDVYAPGSDITSAYWDGTDRYAVLSGTSMAAPHVAGAVACLIAERVSTARCPNSDVLKTLLYDRFPLKVRQNGGARPFVHLNPKAPQSC